MLNLGIRETHRLRGTNGQFRRKTSRIGYNLGGGGYTA
jgi:hypothetical protein